MPVQFQLGAIELTSVPPYGPLTAFTAQGTLSQGTPQTTGYLNWRQDTWTGIDSITLDQPILQNLGPGSASGNVLSGIAANDAISLLVQSPSGRQQWFNWINTGAQSAQYVTLGCSVGSLGAHLEAQWAAILSGKVSGDGTQKAWSSYSASVSGFVSGVPNPSSIVAGLNTSAMSVWRSGRTDDTFPLALITNRHAVTAGHVCPTVGDQVTFRRADGSTQTVTIDAIDRPANYDLGFVHFDAAVSGITPYPLCGIDAFTHTLGGIAGQVLPERLLTLVKAMHRPDGTWASYWGLAYAAWCGYPSTSGQFLEIENGPSMAAQYDAPVRGSFTSSAGVVGDSGSPAFWLVNGVLSLVGVWSQAGGWLTSLVGQETVINTAIAALNSATGDGGSYSLTLTNLASFT